MTLYSFRKFNPDWEIDLYVSPQEVFVKPWTTYVEQDFHNYNGPDYFNKVKDLGVNIKPFGLNRHLAPSHRSNFLKWNKLANIGGIYSDMDILWFKPIEDFYNSIKDFNAAICQTEYLSIGLLASDGENDFFNDIYINGLRCFNTVNYQSAGVENIYNLYRCEASQVLNKATELYPYLKFYNIPMDLVYLYNSERIIEAFTETVYDKELFKNSIGYHWYAAHPTAQKFNSLLNERTYKEDKSLFSQIVQNEIDI